MKILMWRTMASLISTERHSTDTWRLSSFHHLLVFTSSILKPDFYLFQMTADGNKKKQNFSKKSFLNENIYNTMEISRHRLQTKNLFLFVSKALQGLHRITKTVVDWCWDVEVGNKNEPIELFLMFEEKINLLLLKNTTFVHQEVRRQKFSFFFFIAIKLAKNMPLREHRMNEKLLFYDWHVVSIFTNCITVQVHENATTTTTTTSTSNELKHNKLFIT